VVSPVTEAFRAAWRTIVEVVGLNFVSAVGFYFCFIYVTTYLRQTDHIPASSVLDINTISIVTVPAGALSDHWGRKPVLLAASAGLFVMSWPLLWMMHHPSSQVILLGQLGFAALIATFNGAGPAAMAEIAPSRVRCTVVLVGLNLVYGVVGGLTPMIAIYTIKRSGDDLAPAFLLMAMAAVSFAVITRLRETYKLALANQVTESAGDD